MRKSDKIKLQGETHTAIKFLNLEIILRRERLVNNLETGK